ncbi:MAG: DUF2493 domain-containing protein [Bacteroidota bacterium]
MEKVTVFSLSRFSNYELLARTLDDYQIDIMVLGSKGGADLMAQEYALSQDIPTQIFLPDYLKYGDDANYRRNLLMIDNATNVILFWNGHSKSPLTYLDYIKKLRKRFRTVLY